MVSHSSLTPDERRQRARLGGLTTAARHDGRENTARARAAFLVGFLDQVDPDRVLPESERQRRAEAARKLHFSRMAQKSAKVRTANAKKRTNVVPKRGKAPGRPPGASQN